MMRVCPALRVGLSDPFDLQGIQGPPQVKTPQGATCAVLAISLRFKQLARGLHGAFA
jgi:hypothetical protein